MPAELDHSKGRAAILSVGRTPWHREGVVLEQPPRSVDEAIALASLDFQVELAPLYHAPGDGPTPRYSEVGDFLGVRRTDTGAVLGIVGLGYTPLQNRDAFRILGPLMDAGKAAIETAGALRGGRDVWVLVRFAVRDPVVEEIFAGEVVPFGLLSNNHTGERRVVLQETPIRVVCANTLGMALSGQGRKLGIRHSVNVEARTVDAAQELWGGLVERCRVIAQQYRRLKATFLDDALFRQIVLDRAAPIPPRAARTRQGLCALDRIQARRKRLVELWTGGTEHDGNGSAWEAYNALVESLDHDVDLWPTRGSRTASLFDGRLGRLKQRSLDALMEHAAQAGSR